MLHDLPDMALSIRQPWAWAIVNAGKRIENRSWETLRRGPICIHSSASAGTWSDWDDALWFLMQRDVHPPFRYQIEKGGIIGVATITDCITKSDDPWFMGKFGFVLADVRPVPFIPVKGALGFFNWRKRVAGGIANG